MRLCVWFLFSVLFVSVFSSFVFVDDGVVSADDVVEPFLYFYAPSDSFGMNSMKTVNPLFLKQLLSHVDWSLRYKRYSYSDWVNGDEYFGFNLSWNGSVNAYKITIGFDNPLSNVYQAEFNMSFNENILDYIEKTENEILFNYSTNEGMINLVFNYSDLKVISGLYFDRGVIDNRFYFMFGRFNIPQGYYVFDPIFGNSGTGTQLFSAEDRIIGGWFEMPEDGTPTYMNFYLKNNGFQSYNGDIKGLIYDDSGNLVGTTVCSPATISVFSSTWINRSIYSSDCLIGGNNYNLTVWVDSQANGDIKLCADYGGGDGIYYDSESTGCPNTDPWSPVNLDVDDEPCIYVVYTCNTCNETEGCTNNCSIGNLKLNGAVFSNNTHNVEDCGYHNFTIVISDCLGDIDYCNISVDGVGYHNVSDGNGTYYLNITSDLVCDTNYTLRYNVSCQDGGYKNHSWFWFETESCCVVTVEGIDNSSYDNYDYNLTYVNISGFINCSCSDIISYGNITLSTGNYSNSTSESEGLWWANFTGLNLTCDTTYHINFSVSCSDGCGADVEIYHFYLNTSSCVSENCCLISIENPFPVNVSGCYDYNLSYVNISVFLNSTCGNLSFINVSLLGNSVNWSGVSAGANVSHVWNFTGLNLTCDTVYLICLNYSKNLTNCSIQYEEFYFHTCSCVEEEQNISNCCDCVNTSCFLNWLHWYLDYYGYVKESDEMDIDIGLSLMLVLFMCLFLYLCYKINIKYLGYHFILFIGSVFVCLVGADVLLALYSNDVVVYALIGVYLFVFAFLALYKLVLGVQELKNK